MTGTTRVFATYDLLTDLAANRPATPVVANGRLCVFMATDTDVISLWNGVAWQPLPSGIASAPDYVSSGTWTPTDLTSSGITFLGLTNQNTYTIIGKSVLFNLFFKVAPNTSNTFAAVGGLPGNPVASLIFAGILAGTDGTDKPPLCQVNIQSNGSAAEMVFFTMPGVRKTWAQMNAFGSVFSFGSINYNIQ